MLSIEMIEYINKRGIQTNLLMFQIIDVEISLFEEMEVTLTSLPAYTLAFQKHSMKGERWGEFACSEKPANSFIQVNTRHVMLIYKK